MTMTKRLLTLTFSMALCALSYANDAKTCPVTGDPLGGDKGPPIAVTYKGNTIMLCCKSCVRKFNANPEKYAPKTDTKAEPASPDQAKSPK